MSIKDRNDADPCVPVAPLVRSLRAAAEAKHDDFSICEDAAETIVRLRDALIEIRDRLKDHPAYAELTMEEETEVGGDTAEFSYLVRVADEAIDS